MLAVLALTFTSFGGLSLLQAMGLSRNPPPWLRRLQVHAANGFYANAAFNRIAGALRIAPANS
jgi:hypothetical protein